MEVELAAGLRLDLREEEVLKMEWVDDCVVGELVGGSDQGPVLVVVEFGLERPPRPPTHLQSLRRGPTVDS
jgi:hypothetical protein